ncbi:MAG: M48 family metallopeptidase [Oscillospiraceae bacterium]|jgi:predicted metal-dependent hydrolase|nr:M48 family metallopeptidase [Oscillospiraceae bacterium]
MIYRIYKYKGGELPYELVTRRGMKNVRIRVVSKNGNVYPSVSCPNQYPLGKVEKVIGDNLPIILATMENFRTAAEQKPQPPPVEITDGMKLRLFGKVLTAAIADNFPEGDYPLEKDGLLFFRRNMDYIATLNRYLAVEGRRIFGGYFEKYLAAAKYKGVKPTLSLRVMKSRWGHCKHYPDGRLEIMLNMALAGVPVELAEYVAAHEVAHLFVHNHSDEFYRFGETLYKDFKKTDRLLNKGYTTDMWASVSRF